MLEIHGQTKKCVPSTQENAMKYKSKIRIPL